MVVRTLDFTGLEGEVEHLPRKARLNSRCALLEVGIPLESGADAWQSLTSFGGDVIKWI